jgi:hypothetical protein
LPRERKLLTPPIANQYSKSEAVDDDAGDANIPVIVC